VSNYVKAKGKKRGGVGRERKVGRDSQLFGTLGDTVQVIPNEQDLVPEKSGGGGKSSEKVGRAAEHEAGEGKGNCKEHTR